MIAVVAFIPKVIGIRIATPVVGPIPGNTPISVPIRTPIKHIRRFMGESATSNSHDQIGEDIQDSLRPP